jgi:hypothetical protein
MSVKALSTDYLKKKREFLKAQSELILFQLDIVINKRMLSEQYNKARAELERSKKEDSVFIPGVGGYTDEINRIIEIDGKIKDIEATKRKIDKNVAVINKEIGEQPGKYAR